MLNAFPQYLLLTYLLSVGGIVVYLLFTLARLNARTQKRLLVGVVLTSFSAPFLLDKALGNLNAETYQLCLHSHPIPEVLFTQYCPESGSEMAMCIEIARNAEHFCSCPRISQENLLLYKANPTYDLLLANQNAITYLFGLAGAAALAVLVFRLLWLVMLVYRSQKQVLQIGKQRYVLLYPPKSMPVCSFRLHRSYIVWHRSLDFIPTSEREAILWHEISHLSQKDTWYKVALGLLQTVWLFNPVFYFVKKELECLNEFIADEFAVSRVGNVQAYAALLLKLKTQQRQPHFAHSFAPKGSMLKQRISRLLFPPTPKRAGKALSLLFTVALFVSILSIAYFAMPGIANQFDKVKLYEQLHLQNKQTGKAVFCKSCLAKNAFDPNNR